MKKTNKLHLVESCSFPSSTYKNVTKDSKFTNLVESAKQLSNSKLKLSEASLVNKVKQTLTEAKIDTKMQQKVLENLKEAGANVDDVELWQFPISKVNDIEHPNLNGRVYNKKLWENVINDQVDVWKGGTGLANHPADDEDGDFLNQSIVWLDGFIGDDDIVYGIGTFVGEGGALARQIIGVGGRIGFSTSGFGDFLADKITVDPDSYEIDRFADLVLNPSQGVFGDHNDKINKANVVESGNLKESVRMKRNIKEATNDINGIVADIDTIVKACNAKDAVEQLSDIADEKGIDIKLEEGTVSDDIKFKLAAECVATVLAQVTDTGVINEDLKATVANFIESFSEIVNVEDRFKEIARSLSVSEDVLDVFFEENIEEDEETDEDLSLEEQLLVKHYTTQLRAIGKESNKLWEERIQKLNNLSDKLKEATLSNKSKIKLNKQTQNLIESIMKEARNAIQEGFKAKEICEDLGINTIAKLSNIKEKLEDFTSLEECLEKTTKELNKYKSLYENKQKFAVQEAESAYYSEEKINKLNAKVKHLNKSLNESKLNSTKINANFLKAKVEVNSLQEKLAKVLAEKKAMKEQLNKVLNKNESLKDLLDEADKTINTLEHNNNYNKKIIAEKNNTVVELKKQLRDSTASVNSLKINQKKLVNENRKVVENLETLRREDRLQKAKKVIRENAARQESIQKKNNFYDTNMMFKDTNNINNFVESFDASNADNYKNLKTLREAEDKYLFSNELLSDEAELTRSKIRAPEDTPTSLADMFN